MELSQSLDTDSKFQSIMITTSLDCLRSNANSNLPQAIFERLANSRAQLAFALLGRLIKVKSTKVDIQKILPAAWDALRAHETDIGLGLIGENAGFYRLLLKILCLALQTRQITPDAQSSGTDKARSKNHDASHNSLASSKTMQPILGILHVVVAQGFRSLTTVLHEDSTLVVPADFVLIIAILRAALQVPGVENHTTEILSQFSDSQTVRCASALLSWSDQIATNHDPIYGELSIFFLLELSNISTLAETLAVEGILTQILSTNLISYLRQDRGMGPFDSPVRLYSIWFRGLLPLFLNLLHAVGAPMAPEIASTLNNFPGQLSRASRSFESKPISATDPTGGCLTLSMVSEAQNLAMITSILDTFREAGSSAGIIASQVVEPLWDKAQVKEDIELWMQRRTALRDRILPTNEKEEAWVRQPPVLKSNDADNRLEEKVVEEMKTVLMILDSNE